MTTLSDYTIRYIKRRDLSEGYRRTLEKRVAKVERETGFCDLGDVLREDVISAFLETLCGRLSKFTINKYRADILAIWRAAADEDLIPYPIARRVRREKPGPLIPECYTVDEVRALVSAAEKMPGAMPCGVARRVYWPALVRFAYDTGLRRGDCWRFELAMLKPDRTFRIVQAKTRKAIRRIVQKDTVTAMRKIGRPKPFAWTMCEWSFGMHWQEVRELAAIERGTFRWLRRATGSHVEAEHPGAGHKALGNTPVVFSANYDAQLGTEVFAPPTL